MTLEKQTKSLRVEEGRTKLITTHNEKDLTFLHPAYGPNNYANVGEEIERDGLATPTMAETASLVHGAFNSDDKYSKKIKDIMRKERLWAFTGNLYILNKGVYVKDNPEIRDGMPFMEESELVKRLELDDPSVRFVKFGYEIGEMTPLKLGRNKYVIALAGEEGAEKLAEVANKHKYKPYLWSFKSVDQPLTRVSTLDSDWGLDDGRLGVDGNCFGDDRYGYAFGVQKTDEASRAEK